MLDNMLSPFGAMAIKLSEKKSKYFRRWGIGKERKICSSGITTSKSLSLNCDVLSILDLELLLSNAYPGAIIGR